ncbi:TonB-dependent receptor [Picosynechococcus sp. NKBG15041c]|uniref:TonB-dependent receptor n=1 Tax=Picosynechococcus sp. NKBG15041c TaxID=1407650 RepID=UPI0003FECBA1|nr:TonB-dependent receptor [Picosynechococcus sp. NKBG15041c]
MAQFSFVKTVSCVFLYLFCGAIAAAAQTEINLEADSETEDQETVDFELTVIDQLLNQTVYGPSRREETVKDATRAAYVINREQIEAQGYRTVNEALRYFPGIFTDSTSGSRLGAQSSQILRGANNSSQTLILLDGRPINRFDSGAFDLSTLTTDNVERIEVIPGGGSALFGSNAIGGVINIVTRQPEFNQPVVVETGLDLGSFGYNRQRVGVSFGSEAQAVRVAYDRTAADNDFEFDIPVSGLAGIRDNAASNIQNVNLQAITQLGDRHRLRFSGIYSSKDLEIPGSVTFPSPNATQYDNNWLLSLDLESRLGNSDDSMLTTKVFADFNDFRFFNDQFGTTDARYENRSFGTQIQHNWQLSETQNLTYGVDYRYLTATAEDPGVFGFSYDENLSQGAIFARYGWDVSPEFALNFGLRQDFNSLADGSVTSPSAGFAWQVGTATRIRGNYARNFRVPTAVDLYFPGFSNPDLVPETANSFDLGIDHRFSDRALVRLTYFNNTLDDAIVFDLGTFTPQNIQKARNQGLEAELTVQLAPSLSAFANYTWNNSKILADTNPAFVGNEVAFAGTDYFNIGLAYEDPQGIYAGIFLKRVGDRLTNNANTNSLEGYTNVDLRARYPLSETVNLTASVENLFDADFETFPGYPGVERRFQIGVNARFR